jgi:hypothetical protein
VLLQGGEYGGSTSTRVGQYPDFSNGLTFVITKPDSYTYNAVDGTSLNNIELAKTLVVTAQEIQACDSSITTPTPVASVAPVNATNFTTMPTNATAMPTNSTLMESTTVTSATSSTAAKPSTPMAKVDTEALVKQMRAQIEALKTGLVNAKEALAAAKAKYDKDCADATKVLTTATVTATPASTLRAGASLPPLPLQNASLCPLPQSPSPCESLNCASSLPLLSPTDKMEMCAGVVRGIPG